METKNLELSRAVEELSKLVKDAGEGTGLDLFQSRDAHTHTNNVNPCSIMVMVGGFLFII